MKTTTLAIIALLLAGCNTMPTQEEVGLGIAAGLLGAAAAQSTYYAPTYVPPMRQPVNCYTYSNGWSCW